MFTSFSSNIVVVHYKEDYILLRSVPGIGVMVAAGRLSELSDLCRLQDTLLATFRFMEIFGYFYTRESKTSIFNTNDILFDFRVSHKLD